MNVDIRVPIPADLAGTAESFIDALGCIDRLYGMQLSGEITALRENRLWRELTAKLGEGGSQLSGPGREGYEAGIRALERGIFDLYPLTAGLEGGGGEIELVIGKVFSTEGGGESCYAGAAGVLNRGYGDVIGEYDGHLALFAEKLPFPAGSKKKSAENSFPEIRCMDVFSLAGGLNLPYKPICVFYSGKSRENLSSLSRMTVFINLYTERFRAITEKIALSYISGTESLEGLSYDDTARLLLIWLRGHDVGHFMGADRLGKAMREMDRDYMILHELKSDMIALYNMRHLTDGLLREGMLERAYLLSVAEMFRYMRRGGFYSHPDTGSAYLAYRFFSDAGAIIFDEGEGKFSIDFKRFEDAVEECTAWMIKLFSEGDISRARGFVNSWGWLAAAEKDGLPRGIPDELRGVITDTEIPHYIDYNFVTASG